MADHKRSYEDYTVAIVCAMSFEMSAVRYMLNHSHPRLRSKSGDPNLYALGDLHGHDVVIACLPSQQGTAAAAIVAANMARTFPSIKWRFIVGIAGGVPDTQDVRLGDVVISMPEGQHTGVVKYDLGMPANDVFLLPPPTRLRAAVDMMRSDHLCTKNKIKEYVDLMLQGVQGTDESDDSDDELSGMSVYARPAAASDILFDADYPHNSGTSSCVGCDKSKVVERRKRRSSKIHYGLIASGNSVIKSALQRRQAINRLGPVLCFEMEAAGILTDYPCLVIRGISDYADSHKNDQWHHFAAAAAAASTKELLSYLDPEDLVGHLSVPTHPCCLEAATTTDRSASVKLLADLHVTNPAHDKQRIEAAKGGLLTESCRWILNNQDYLQWRQGHDHHLLWLTGDPGKGKTMLLCGIIDELNNAASISGTPAPAYFFCQANDVRLNNATGVLRGLLYMLLRQHPHLFCYVQAEYEISGRSLFEDVNAWFAMSSIFTGMLSDPSMDGKILIIDALDECTEDVEKLLTLLSTVCCAKWIVSSRKNQTIESTFRKTTATIQLCLESNTSAIASAVRNFIRHRVTELADLKEWDDIFAGVIEQQMVEKAKDTFLWAAPVCQELADPEIEGSQALEVLESLPPGLEPIYQRMLETVSNSRNAERSRKILALASVVYRPLATDELLYILKSLPGAGGTLPSISKMIACCGNFLTLRDNEIFFIHESAKKFLLGSALAQIVCSGVTYQDHTIPRACSQKRTNKAHTERSILGPANRPVGDLFSGYAKAIKIVTILKQKFTKNGDTSSAGPSNHTPKSRYIDAMA